ncbi:hypothetical protein AB0C34_17790 [Nocardia sp. NPDC049220]
MDVFFGRTDLSRGWYVKELTALHYRIGSVLLEHNADRRRAATDL